VNALTAEQIAALPASRALDAEVAEKVLGWLRTPTGLLAPVDALGLPPSTDPIALPHFSTDMAAAWLALAKCCHEWEIGCDPAGWGDVKIYGWRGTPDDGDDVEHRVGFGHISKAPAAICKALLLDALTR
jgi:hypothetical protein